MALVSYVIVMTKQRNPETFKLGVRVNETKKPNSERVNVEKSDSKNVFSSRQLQKPVWLILKQLDGPVTALELAELVGNHLGLSARLMSIPHLDKSMPSSDKRTKLEYRVYWALTKLKHRGYAINFAAKWNITEHGRKVSEKDFYDTVKDEEMFLFSWNPAVYEWRSKIGLQQKIANREEASELWRSKLKKVPDGSICYLIQQGTGNKGIIARGYSSGPMIISEEPSKADATKMKTKYRVKICFEQIFDAPKVTWEQLKSPPFVDYNWGIMASGVRLPAIMGHHLDEIWDLGEDGAPTLYQQRTARPYWVLAPGMSAKHFDRVIDTSEVFIGWKEIGDLGSYTNAEEVRKRLEDLRLSKKSAKNDAKCCWQFANEVKKGDLVFLKKGLSRLIAVARVVGPYYFKTDESEFPHRISVEIISQKVIKFDDFEFAKKTMTKFEFDSIYYQKIHKAYFDVSEAAYKTDLDTQDWNITMKNKKSYAINEIHYGPPGTGKTYNSKNRALELLDVPIDARSSQKAINERFRELQAERRIAFVTFHQSYGYEDFVEGIRPVLDSAKEEGLKYFLHDGVFKRMAIEAAYEGLVGKFDEPTFDQLWDELQDEIASTGELDVVSQNGYAYLLTNKSSTAFLITRNAIGEETTGDGSVPKKAETQGLGEMKYIARSAFKKAVSLFWDNRKTIGPEPTNFSYAKMKAIFAAERGGQGGHEYTAPWLVYTQLYRLSQKIHRVSSPSWLEKVRAVQRALAQPKWNENFSFNMQTRQYVIIVDEINRGNISKIFGELITLIEPSKRIGAIDALALPLVYSQNSLFAVPPNLHIIGTMNTSDRSIAVMDIALRRRFSFIPAMPDLLVLRAALSRCGKNKALNALVEDVFVSINRRIINYFDEDHQLGHFFFMDIKNCDDFLDSMLQKVVPTLLEYAYNNWEKVCLVLNCSYDSDESTTKVVDLEEHYEPHLKFIVRGQSNGEDNTKKGDDLENSSSYRVVSRNDIGVDNDKKLRLLISVLSLKPKESEDRLTHLRNGETESDGHTL